MMGRRLRAPNDLLRASQVTQVGAWSAYHRHLVEHMNKASELAKLAVLKDQLCRERHCNKSVRSNALFRTGDLVWILKPPRGKGITKLAHQWIGPARIDGDAGFDNWRVTRLDTREELVVHCAFLLSYHYPLGQKETVAVRILAELAEDEISNGVEREPTKNLSRQEVGGDQREAESTCVEAPSSEIPAALSRMTETGGDTAGRPGPAEPRAIAMATANGD
ncbi:unnamed protein product [Phytophthora fragariaefolia]|uniref:Unnamed protein product n=1 Tax=Phytophthora fragariaefolia TaxID=1490495 RepID=A0A9W6YH34_9STRA|nr:unnamed protein product [Phytophthora fragariaefolia]